MQSMRESAANAGASVKAGMEKAKATTQEKVDKMKTRDPTEKEMARERKEDRMELAEQRKQEARDQNATARQAGGAGGYTTGVNERGDRLGYGDANRGFTTAGTTGYDDNLGYAGDRAGGYAYSTTGTQDYRSGEHETRLDDLEAPNTTGTRRNTRVDEHPYGTSR